MDSNMSTAAYVHRTSGSSSSSSACSSTGVPTAMANGNPSVVVPGGGGGGSKMAVIGVTRNVKLRRRGAAGFGFSLRGGREYAAGFYVSDVVPGGEAHRNGLRVGDQILRVNGYPVEDAVHQEVALLAKNQQILVLKIRSVGMIPVKDNPNDPVTWHMVQQQQQQLQYGDAVTSEVRIRVLLGEKGKLGCGVCRGLVPGLTVQGTREGGAARAAGLKAGDVITWCNGQSLTDLPFERAIEVMRNAAVLDLVVNRPIANHVYDCPEALWLRGSSGYDSESSSLVGPSPPPPPMQQQQQQIMTASLSPHRLGPCNRNGRNCCPSNGTGPADWGHVEQPQEWMRKPNNTTVIRISQSHPPHYPASHPHGHHPQQQQQQQYGRRVPNRHPHQQHVRTGSNGIYDDAGQDEMLLDEEPLYDPVAPKDFECHDFDANPRDELDRRAEYRREHGIRSDGSYEPSPVDDVYIKENGQPDGGSVVLGGSGNVVVGGGGLVVGNGIATGVNCGTIQRQTGGGAAGDKDRKTVTTVEVHQPSPPAPPSMPPPLPYKWPAESKPMNAMGMQMGSTMSMGSTGSTETESSLESSSCVKDTVSTTSSLSASSSCEAAAAAAAATAVAAASSAQSFASAIAAAAACGTGAASKSPQEARARAASASAGGSKPVPPPPPPQIDLGTAITQELQRRAKQRLANQEQQQQQQQQPGEKAAQEGRKPQNPEALRAQEQKVTHDKLMEEFKRAHQRMFSNAQQRQAADQTADQNEEKRSNTNNNSNSSSNNNNNNNVTKSMTVNNKTASQKNGKADDLVEMQSIESFKLKNSSTTNVKPRPPSTYFPPTNGTVKLTNGTAGTQNGCARAQNGEQPPAVAPKPTVVKTANNVSKVAIRIGSYEGDSRQPARLGFLANQDGKSSTTIGNGSSPVASRFQNELVATLQRSNLRKKTEGETEIPPVTEEADKTTTTTMTTSVNYQENGQAGAATTGSVEKLATALGNKVTIRVNPDQAGGNNR